MNAPQPLSALVRELWQTKLRPFNLAFVDTSDHEAALVGDNFVLTFYSDRDGLGGFYYRIPNDIAAPLQYDPARFLFLKRMESEPRPPKQAFSSFSEEAAYGLSRLVTLLIERCPDILRGEDAWIKDYEARWGHDVVHPLNHKKLREIYRRGLAQRSMETTATR